MRRKKLSLANLSRGGAAENPGLVYVISRGKIKVQRSRLMGWSWPLTLEKRETSFLSFHRLLSVAWPTRHAHLVHMCDVAHPKTKVGNHWPQARKSVIPFPKWLNPHPFSIGWDWHCFFMFLLVEKQLHWM